MATVQRCMIAAALVGAVDATGTSMTMTRGNPIRKVVTKIQKIAKKVEEEGKTAEDLFDKFMCECKQTQTALTKGIEAAEAKSGDVAAAAEAGAAEAKQLSADIAQAKKDRAAAKEAIAAATGIREKEAKAFKASSEESKANIEAMGSAISAIKSGGSSFLQTAGAKKLHELVQANQIESDREEITAFLQGEDGAEGTGEIVGMLSQQQETMQKDLSEDEAAEADAVKTYKELVAAKNKEFNTLQAAIEEKMARAGELGVANAENANDGGDTGDQLEADKKLLADSKASCAARTKEWEAEKKLRGEELLALADTVKMLNSDEALELFKKALPSASASFMQIQVSTAQVKAQAVAALQKAQKHHNPKLDFVLLALRGKKVGLDAVISMIDKMIGALKMDQKEDDDKKAYCEAEFDKADDEKKAGERKVADAETAIKDAKESQATLAKEIEATKAAIVELDGEVAIAGAQRQQENAAFKELVTQNAAAEQLITMAKARLEKFYGKSFVQVQSGTSNAIITMLQTLITDLQKETAVAETEEANAQEDYEKTMADAKVTRTSDAKLLEDKESAIADADQATQDNVDAKTVAEKELQGVKDYIMTLRADCDWLIQYYDTRKQARGDEIDAMAKAKDVLNGADFSFLQTVSEHSQRRLRGAQQ